MSATALVGTALPPLASAGWRVGNTFELRAESAVAWVTVVSSASQPSRLGLVSADSKLGRVLLESAIGNQVRFIGRSFTIADVGLFAEARAPEVRQQSPSSAGSRRSSPRDGGVRNPNPRFNAHNRIR